MTPKSHITLTQRVAYLLPVRGARLKNAMKACVCSESHGQHLSIKFDEIRLQELCKEIFDILFIHVLRY